MGGAAGAAAVAVGIAESTSRRTSTLDEAGRPLPTGWQMITDTALSPVPYYLYAATDESRWTSPNDEAVQAQAAAVLAAAAEAALWEEVANEDTGIPYWRHTLTGETSWTPPAAAGDGADDAGAADETGADITAASLPAAVGDWHEVVSDDPDIPAYWLNSATGESAWERPGDVLYAEDPLSAAPDEAW